MTTLRRLWTSDAPLTAGAGLMLAVLAASLAGLWLDPRVIAGAPAWLKPAKFAASTAIYLFTLAWIFRFLPDRRRLRRRVGWTTVLILVAEVALIDVQAWRGTTSHYNIGTPLDAVIFAAMGIGIIVQTVSSVAVAVALWRQPFADPALGWALRVGLVITIAGASTGGLMTRPTAAQLADARAGHRMTVAGAHTVGAPDGGPGLLATGWSLRHGDLRVPHFVGLHGVQMVPLLAWLAARGSVAASRRVRLVLVVATSYAVLYVVLLAQALRGEALVDPSAATLAALGVWACATVVAAWMALSGAPSQQQMRAMVL